MTMDSEQARAALAAVDGAQSRLAAAMNCPPWRHAAFGAVCAGLVLAVTVPQQLYAPVFVTSMAAMAWLFVYDRRRTGVFVNGFRMGRTLPVSLGLLACLIILVFLGVPERHLPFPTPRGLLCVAAAFVVATLASVISKRIYVSELRKELA